MKTIFRLLSVLAAASLIFLQMADRHPPPALDSGEILNTRMCSLRAKHTNCFTAKRGAFSLAPPPWGGGEEGVLGLEGNLTNTPHSALSAFAAGPSLPKSPAGCLLDPNFEPVHHTAKRQVKAIFRDLALAAGNDPETYSIELMQDRRGHRAINAMTCANSRVIWISVTAWEQLHDHEPALALILAHELAHADHRHPAKLKDDQMTAAERKLLSGLTLRQKVEIAADHRAADLMGIAGYTTAQINNASRYILARDENGLLSKATVSHPAGRDRINLMTFYLGRTMVPNYAR